MTNFSTIDWAIFCLAAIALVAIVHRKDEIALKAVSAIEKTVSALGETIKKIRKPTTDA